MDRSAHSRLAVTYRRISSLNQVDNNSMCAQEQAIKDYAKKNHLKIVEAFMTWRRAVLLYKTERAISK